jgi:hypothetical protein
MWKKLREKFTERLLEAIEENALLDLLVCRQGLVDAL